MRIPEQFESFVTTGEIIPPTSLQKAMEFGAKLVRFKRPAMRDFGASIEFGKLPSVLTITCVGKTVDEAVSNLDACLPRYKRKLKKQFNFKL